MKVTIRTYGKEAGVICMPLVSNVLDGANRHPDWRQTVCPVCGTACWETELCREVMKQQKDLQATCTVCAIKQGLGLGMGRSI